MKRLIEKMVFLGLVTAWRLATWPTSRSPSLVNATTDGVVRPPSALGMTTGSPPSMTATTELVVPRSMPMIFEAMLSGSFLGEFAHQAPRLEAAGEWRAELSLPWATTIPRFSANMARRLRCFMAVDYKKNPARNSGPDVGDCRRG